MEIKSYLMISYIKNNSVGMPSINNKIRFLILNINVMVVLDTINYFGVIASDGERFNLGGTHKSPCLVLWVKSITIGKVLIASDRFRQVSHDGIIPIYLGDVLLVVRY